MAAKKRNRQQERAKALAHARRRAAYLARRKRIRKRRMTIGAVVAVVAALGVLALALVNNSDDGGGEQAASPGKCVEVADPLPPGAPAVPVKVGDAPTALIKEDLKEGTGAEVAAGQNLTVNYIGVACSTGKIFDSSYSRNEPAEFALTGVIPGWQEGIPGMKVGGQRLLGIPPEQAYGAQGSPPDIGPNETLWFVVEVLDAKPPA